MYLHLCNVFLENLSLIASDVNSVGILILTGSVKCVCVFLYTEQRVDRTFNQQIIGTCLGSGDILPGTHFYKGLFQGLDSVLQLWLLLGLVQSWDKDSG